MTTTPQPFSPDDDYCVYCHAPAAGQCAVCAALCCGDCVELGMGLTRQIAVCRNCVQEGRAPSGGNALLWWGVGVFALVAAFVFWLAP